MSETLAPYGGRPNCHDALKALESLTPEERDALLEALAEAHPLEVFDLLRIKVLLVYRSNQRRSGPQSPPSPPKAESRVGARRRDQRQLKNRRRSSDRAERRR
jgi:hypothetical protein